MRRSSCFWNGWQTRLTSKPHIIVITCISASFWKRETYRYFRSYFISLLLRFIITALWYCVVVCSCDVWLGSVSNRAGSSWLQYKVRFSYSIATHVFCYPMSLTLIKCSVLCYVKCLSNALHSSIGQSIKLPGVSGLRSPMSGQSVINVEQMPITQQRVIRSTSYLVLGWVFFSKDRLALFNLTAHELHELYYYDIGLLLREALDRLHVRLNMYLDQYYFTQHLKNSICLLICHLMEQRMRSRSSLDLWLRNLLPQIRHWWVLLDNCWRSRHYTADAEPLLQQDWGFSWLHQISICLSTLRVYELNSWA